MHLLRMRRRQFIRASSWLLAIAALIFLYLRDQRRQSSQVSSTLPNGWVRLENCRLVDDRNNDGDSFVLTHQGRNFTFRLYFVDCPEKELRRDNEQRLHEQARYFGLESPELAAQVGQSARAFTLALLERPCTVFTRWDRVYDSHRHYAQIMVAQHDGTVRDLAELLVENGLCRIHTRGVKLPSNESERNFQQRLRRIELAARENRVGAWKR